MKLNKALKKLDRATRRQIKKMKHSGVTTEKDIKATHAALKGKL